MKSVTFFKAGTEVTGEDILRMEVKRARHMMALLMDKLGADGMVKVFANEIAAHEANERDWSRRANGRFRSSVAEAHVAAGDGAAFIKWFWDGYRGPNSAAMLRAHPEHLGALSLPGERVGILEVPGHTQFPALLKFRHLDDWSGVPIELAPDMPHRMMGRIESIDGGDGRVSAASIQGYVAGVRCTAGNFLAVDRAGRLDSRSRGPPDGRVVQLVRTLRPHADATGRLDAVGLFRERMTFRGLARCGRAVQRSAVMFRHAFSGRAVSMHIDMDD
ncbi:hypothetical protein [Burkholderia cenocepacia]|uniref:hypothetical protein n=1 Tax=Burkholderia cenocepacia TaxID=95486 RepID=UPI002010D9B9|nr:hypothetical protein [Burkholderia cenocepacia]